MKRLAGAVLVSLPLALAAQTPGADKPSAFASATADKKGLSLHVPKPVASHAPATTTMLPAEQNVVVQRYCVGCHSERGKAGGLSLASFDAAQVVDHAELAEKMIRKLRAGMMPPVGARRPDAATMTGLVESFEARIDRAAAVNPNPGSRPSQRLNRAEYARAVRDLLAIDVDVAAYLPPDTISDGFDNIADSQTISSTLMEGYLRAASQISRLAVGDRNASASSTTWKVPRTASQMRHVDGAPLGTRGGMSVRHVFPADGDYIFKIMLHMGPTGDLFGGPYRGEQIEVSLNGERIALLDINPRMNEQDPNGMNMATPRIHVKAGQHRVSAAFVQKFDGPADDLIMPIEHTLADTNIGEVFGTTALTHLRDFTVTGPMAVTGVSDTGRPFTGEGVRQVQDLSGVPPIPYGGPGVLPLHAASGVGYGEGFAANAHRYAPAGFLPAIQYLIEELGADVNATDHEGNTAVHLAASRGDNESIVYLVTKGADVTRVNREGNTTADMANGPVQRVQPFPETLQLLEKLGAKNNHKCITC